ncbi:hypothetical protein J4Q44_G00108610 [Coregonus suidteri]|uniref:USP domain-containing protein n=1 Tax=Coregonus suidteri TaxID=861788 RepID=A0AAN8LVZ7_9TELE
MAKRRNCQPKAAEAYLSRQKPDSSQGQLSHQRVRGDPGGPEENGGPGSTWNILGCLTLATLASLTPPCSAFWSCLYFSKEILRQEQLWSSSPFSNLLRSLSDVHRSGLPDSGAKPGLKSSPHVEGRTRVTCEYAVPAEGGGHDSEDGRGELIPALFPQLEFQLVSVRTCTRGCGPPAKRLSQVADTVFQVLGHSEVSVTGLPTGIDTSMMQALEMQQSCGRESSTREDYNNLSLDFSPERTLLSSLALTFKGEKVEFTCEGCKGLQASKVEQFHTLPLVLVLHLKRFGGPGGLEKLEAPLLFPPELRLSDLCGDMVPPLHIASPQALTNQDPSILVSIPQTKTSQVSSHQTLTSQVSSPPGQAKDSALCCSGHYVSDILNASGNWFCCNDSQVSMSSEATVLRTRARSAYLLFYMFRTGEQQASAHRA